MFQHQDLTAGEGLMVVISNSELFHNVTLSDTSSGNASFAANLADWLAQDAALIGLRSRGKKIRPITDFGSVYAQQHGGFQEGESGHNEELDRAAQNHVRSQQRLIAWGNVLLPPFLVLLFALFHRTWHGRRARQPFQAGGKS
jgi:ABC-type uncharacterized transport system involved in gliding motility auxiliary subunit